MTNEAKFATDRSPDGCHILYREHAGNWNLWAPPLEGERLERLAELRGRWPGLSQIGGQVAGLNRRRQPAEVARRRQARLETEMTGR